MISKAKDEPKTKALQKNFDPQDVDKFKVRRDVTTHLTKMTANHSGYK